MTLGPAVLADLSAFMVPRPAGRAPVDAAVPSVPPALGYSVRRLRTSYNGPCMRVLKLGGSAADIGFDSAGNVDVAALRSHVGDGQGVVTIWYNQGTAGVNIGSQASTGNLNQTTISYLPRVTDEAGNLHTVGPFARPTLRPAQGPMYLNDAALARFPGNFTVLTVVTAGPGTSSLEHLFGNRDHWQVMAHPTGRGGFRYRDEWGQQQTTGGSSWALEPGNAYRYGWHVERASNGVMLRRRINGRQDDFWFNRRFGAYSGDGAVAFGVFLQQGGAGRVWTGTCSEILAFSTRLTDQQTQDVEASQIAYYGVS